MSLIFYLSNVSLSVFISTYVSVYRRSAVRHIVQYFRFGKTAGSECLSAADVHVAAHFFLPPGLSESICFKPDSISHDDPPDQVMRRSQPSDQSTTSLFSFLTKHSNPEVSETTCLHCPLTAAQRRRQDITLELYLHPVRSSHPDSQKRACCRQTTWDTPWHVTAVYTGVKWSRPQGGDIFYTRRNLEVSGWRRSKPTTL